MTGDVAQLRCINGADLFDQNTSLIAPDLDLRSKGR
jgi:hypothetical protein